MPLVAPRPDPRSSRARRRSQRCLAESAFAVLVFVLAGSEEDPILFVDELGECFMRRAGRVRPECEVRAWDAGGPSKGGVREDSLEAEAIGSGIGGAGVATVSPPPKQPGNHPGDRRWRGGEERRGQGS